GSNNLVNFTVTTATIPTIGLVQPGHGAVGQAVTITGSNFTQITKVLFNNKEASFRISNDALITASVPLTATTGFSTVSGPNGAAFSPTIFTVDNAANPATHFGISAPATAVAGKPINVTVTALDKTNTSTNTYGGTVTLSSIPGFSSIVPRAAHTF